MTYKLFIDDERYPVGDSWVIARTSNEAVEVIKEKGVPSFISFDHDLGDRDTSMIFIHKMIDFVLDGDMIIPDDFDFYVHSQNPIGKQNIEGILNSFINRQIED